MDNGEGVGPRTSASKPPVSVLGHAVALDNVLVLTSSAALLAGSALAASAQQSDIPSARPSTRSRRTFRGSGTGDDCVRFGCGRYSWSA